MSLFDNFLSSSAFEFDPWYFRKWVDFIVFSLVTVKQRCAQDECISNNDNFYNEIMGFIYPITKRGERVRDRIMRWSASVQSSWRSCWRIVLQELLLNTAASKDKDAWWKFPRCDVYDMDNSWRRSCVGHMTQKCLCTRYSFLIMNRKLLYLQEEIFSLRHFGLTTNHIFR